MSLMGKIHHLEAQVSDAKSQHGTTQSQIDATKLPEPEVFRQLGAHFQNWGSQQQEHMQQLENGHTALKASWQGDGADTYSNMHTQMKGVSDKHLEHHQQASNDFNHAADETEMVKKLLKDAAKEGLKAGGFAIAASISVGIALATFWVPIEGEIAVGAAAASVIGLLAAISALVNIVQALTAAVHELTNLVKAIFAGLRGLLPGSGGKPQNPPAAPPNNPPPPKNSPPANNPPPPVDGQGGKPGGGKGGGSGSGSGGSGSGGSGSGGSGSGSGGSGSGGSGSGSGGSGSGSGGSGSGSGGSGSGNGRMNMGPQTQAIIQLLQESPQGQNALRIQQTYHVTVVYGRAGGGTYYSPGTNTVVIDPNSGTPANVALVHEMTHAEYANTNRTASSLSLNQTDYVNASLNEETDAQVNEILYNVQTGGNPIIGQRTFVAAAQQDPAYQPAYQQAYQQAYDQALNAPRGESGGPVTRAAAERIGAEAGRRAGIQAGQASGRQAIYNAFVQGRFRTSNGGTPYPQYYANQWANAQRSASSATQPPASGPASGPA